jgi:predicted RND superfamily exporter protein
MVPLLVVALATAVLGLHAARLGIEHDNASLTAVDATQAAIDAEFRAAFAGGDELLLTLTRPDLLDGAGLRQIDAVTTAVAGWDGVRRVWSLTNVEELVHGDVGAEPRRLLAPPWDDDVDTRARAAVDRNSDLTGWLVSSDRTTAGILIDLEERPHDEEYRTRLIGVLRGLAAREARDGAALHLTGVPVQKHDVSAYVARDQRVLLPLAVLVLGAALAAFFRRPAGVLLPLAVAGCTVVWTSGLYAWTGHETNAITALLPPVLLTVALVVGVHVYEAWRTAVGEADPATRALAAVRAVAAAGGPLHRHDGAGLPLPRRQRPPGRGAVRPVRRDRHRRGLRRRPDGDAGAPHLAPPAAAAHRGARAHPPAARPDRAPRDHAPRAHRRPLHARDRDRRRRHPRIRANTDLVGFLTEDAPLRRDTTFIDAHLTGTLPFDFLLRRRDGGAIASLDALHRLDALEAAIRARPLVTTVTSALALVRQVHRAETDGATLALPGDDRTLRDELNLLDESGHELVRRFAAPGFRALRLSVRLRAVGTAESAPLVAAVLADADRLLGPEYTLAPTGELYRVVHDSTGLVRQQVTSFGTAIVLVVLAIGLIFRSLTFTILALIPNVLPIFWTGGLMGFAGIELSTGTAMIASAVSASSSTTRSTTCRTTVAPSTATPSRPSTRRRAPSAPPSPPRRSA